MNQFGHQSPQRPPGLGVWGGPTQVEGVRFRFRFRFDSMPHTTHRATESASGRWMSRWKTQSDGQPHIARRCSEGHAPAGWSPECRHSEGGSGCAGSRRGRSKSCLRGMVGPPTPHPQRGEHFRQGVSGGGWEVSGVWYLAALSDRAFSALAVPPTVFLDMYTCISAMVWG